MTTVIASEKSLQIHFHPFAVMFTLINLYRQSVTLNFCRGKEEKLKQRTDDINHEKDLFKHRKIYESFWEKMKQKRKIIEKWKTSNVRFFACVKLVMLVEKIFTLFIFLLCDSKFVHIYALISQRRRRIFHVMTVKVSSFPFEFS